MKYILPAALLFVGVAAIAQRDTSIYFQTAEFEGERRIFLRDANKLSTNPMIKEQVSDMTSIKYSTLPTRKIATIDPELIKAAKINVDEKLSKLYRGYIKAGYGSYYTPLVDVYYTDGRSKKGTFGIHYKHISSSGGVTPNDKDSIPDNYSDNKAELWGKYFLKKGTIQGGLNWERNLAHWYAIDNTLFDATDSRVKMDQLRQRLNTFGGNASYQTINRDTAELNYKFDLAIRGTSDLFHGKETNVDWVAGGNKLVDTELFSAELGINYNTFTYLGPDLNKYGQIVTDEDSIMERNYDNTVIRLVPMAQTVWRDLRAKVGMGMYIEGRGDNPGHFYPLAELSYNIANGLVVPYAGVRGSVEPTTYLGLYQQNPFISNFPDLRNRNNKLDAYGGIGGAISRTVSYSAGVNYYSWDNFAYFVNDSIYSVGNQFLVVYDQLKALNVHGELAVYNGEKWKANARGDYFNYTLGEQVHAWQQPNLKITASGQYNLKNKFIISTDIFYLGKRWAKSNSAVKGVEAQPDGSYQYQMKGFLDANFKVEYRYNKRLSAWVQLNNTLAAKYQRWSSYNNQRFLALMGATYAF